MSAELQDAQRKLGDLLVKLSEIEKLKKLEPALRREAEALQEKIKDLESGDAFHNRPAEEYVPPEEKTMSKEEEDKKRLRTLNKKLQQIEALKQKGGELDDDARKKVASEGRVKREIAAIKAGEIFDPDQDESDHERCDLPSDPVEAEKKLKALQKKLQQIETLKQNNGALDPEARAKVASEAMVKEQIAALQRGEREAVLKKEDPEEAAAQAREEAKLEAEKKLKAVNKKLSQIAKLKETGGEMDADAKAKVASEAALKKEAHTLTQEIAGYNRIERERVEARLGWEPNKTNGKKSKGKK